MSKNVAQISIDRLYSKSEIYIIIQPKADVFMTLYYKVLTINAVT